MRNFKMELLSIAVQMGWYGGRAMPTLLVGVPGTAKTSGIERIGEMFTPLLREQGMLTEDEQFEVFTAIMPQTSPTSIEGVSVPNSDRTEVNRLPLTHMKRMLSAKYGMIFGDELSSAQDETGAAWMGLTQDGWAGDNRITWRIARVFAMNPSWCAAAGRELSVPECNRFLWISNWSIPTEDYCDYLQGGPGILAHVRMLPKDWEHRYGQRTRNLLAMFIKTHPRLKNELEKQESIVENGTTQVEGEIAITENGPWGSERSWESAMRLCAAILSLGEDLNSELCYLAVEGCVGARCREAWFEWLRTADFPDVEEMLKDPEEAQKWLAGQRSDKRKLQLEQVAYAGMRKDGFNIDQRLARWNAAWDVIGPTLMERRDDAMGAARMLAKALPSKSALDNKWFVMLRDLAKDGIHIDSMKLNNA